MRDIKFQLWDKELKCLVEPSAYLMSADGKIIYFNNDGDLIDHTFKLIKRQYTGLKDKNGKEIYEGDKMLVEYSAGTEGDYKYEAVVEFEDGAYRLEGNTLSDVIWWICASCDPSINHPSLLGDIFEVKFEIIGNIYETPNS